jgi:hypothetical protein
MTNHSKDQEAIIALLTRIYLDIMAIEEEFKLFAGAGDMRPRIDYFHDAIRAFTADEKDNKRLNVEQLAYDISCLQYIVKMPTSPFREGGENLSPSQTMMTTEGDLMSLSGRIDRKTRTRISELYQNYAVMFAALLKPTADYDYQERTDDLNNQVQDLNQIINQFMSKGGLNINSVAAHAQNLEEPEMRLIIATFLQQEKHKNAADVTKLVGHLKNQIIQKDKLIKTIDNAHLKFATTQLAIFEESRDMLKKLAGLGTNIVGKFVEESVKATKKQMGR